MLSAWKDIMLQVMLSGVFAFQIPLLFSRRKCAEPEDREVQTLRFRKLVAAASAAGIVLCFAFAVEYQGAIPINLGILPLFVGILYGSRLTGLLLAVLLLGCHELIYGYSLSGMLLHTGLPVYPLMFLIASRFKRSTVMEKIGWLWTGLLPALLIMVASPVLENRLGANAHNSETFLVTLSYVLISIFNGSLLIYIIETIYGRLCPDRSRKEGEQRAVLQQFIEMLPLGIAVMDARGQIVLLNEPMTRGYLQECPYLAPSDLPGRGIESMFEGTSRKNIIHGRVRAALSGTASRSEVIRSIGHAYSASFFPLIEPRSKTVQGAVAVIQDITELEKLRTELIHVERLSMVGQMAASITHEIRNPMAVVRGFLQLMKEKSPDSLDHYYRIVMDELDRANSIISDFLSLAQNRISEKEESHLHDIIQELSPLLWADANLRGQSIELQLGDDIPALLLNTKEIKQLILNLCRNAMEAMDEKGVLTIATKQEDDTVELIVQDTGIGIPQAKLDRLFEPFFTTKSKGTGLGLALCLSIMQRHHGTITVTSELEQGTRFIASFPLGRS